VVLTNPGAHTLAWFDVTAQKTLYTFDVLIPFTPVAVSSDGSSVWVVSTDGGSNNRGYLVRYPIASLNTPDVYDNGTDPSYQFNYPTCVASDGSSVWIGNRNGASITQVNALTGAYVKNISLPGSRPFSLSLDTSSVWVADKNQTTVWKLNRLQGTVDTSFSDSVYQFNDICGVASDGSSVWVSNYSGAQDGNGSVTQMSAQNGDFIKNWSNQDASYGFVNPYAVASDGSFVYVGNYGGVSVTKFNAITGAFDTSYSFFSSTYCGVATDGTRLFTCTQEGIYETYQNNTIPLESGLNFANIVNNVSTDGTYTWVVNRNVNILYHYLTFEGPNQVTFSPSVPFVNQPFSVSLYTPTINVIPGFRTMFVEPHQYQLREGNAVVSNDYSYDSATHIITFHNVVLTNPGAHTLTWVDMTDQRTLYEFILNINITCFKEGTKILTERGYRLIQDLRKGDLVKTYQHGFQPINSIGKSVIYHPASQDRIKDQLYRCTHPEVFEDLVITGCHSILVPHLKNKVQWEKTKVLTGAVYQTDDLFRLPACLDEDHCVVYEPPGSYTIYHFALEHPNYYYNYGVYANGLLVETCSQRYLNELSGMELIE
jgi:hypothetical protein